jgi:hypothetical protein
LISRRIDHLGRTVRAFRLKARGGIGKRFASVIETEAILSPRARVRNDTSKVSIALAFERKFGGLNDDRSLAMIRRPDAKIDAAADQLRSDRPPPE